MKCTNQIRRYFQATAILSAMALGCSAGLRTINVAGLHGPYQVTDSATTSRGEITVLPGSLEERKFIAWLEQHQTGWSSSLDTFAPGRLVVRGKDFTLNQSGDKCVLGITQGIAGGQHQFVKPLTAEDIERLRACFADSTADVLLTR